MFKDSTYIDKKQKYQEELIVLEEQRDSLYKIYLENKDFKSANNFLAILKKVKSLSIDIISVHKEEIQSYSFDNDTLDKVQHEAKVSSIELDKTIIEWETELISNDLDNLTIYLEYKAQKRLVEEKLATFSKYNDPNAGKQLIPMFINLLKIDINILDTAINANYNNISTLQSNMKSLKEEANTDKKKSILEFLLEKTCRSLKRLLKRKSYLRDKIQILNINILKLEDMKSSFEDRQQNKYERKQDRESLIILVTDALEQTSIDNIIDDFQEYKEAFIY